MTVAAPLRASTPVFHVTFKHQKTSMPQLPPELISKVAKELLSDGDLSSLRAASLGCVLFRNLFQEALWSNLELDDFKESRGRSRKHKTKKAYAPGEKLLQVLQESPVLVSYIRTLDIRETQGVNWTCIDPRLPEVLRLIALAGKVQTILCRLMELDSPTIPKTLEEGLTHVFGMSSLVRVEVSNVPTTLLCFTSFNLKYLIIDLDKERSQDLPPPPPAMPSRHQLPSIVDLRIPTHCSRFLTDASSRVDLRGLKELTITRSETSPHSDRRTQTLPGDTNKLLTMCGPSLTELSLEKDVLYIDEPIDVSPLENLRIFNMDASPRTKGFPESYLKRMVKLLETLPPRDNALQTVHIYDGVLNELGSKSWNLLDRLLSDSSRFPELRRVVVHVCYSEDALLKDWPKVEPHLSKLLAAGKVVAHETGVPLEGEEGRPG
ncbi:hypothetical protein BKA70DRAFT_1573337, partial [Coprinopsis sp. MPI-PUGE-AT-0042]